MKLTEYLKDKVLLLLLHMVCMAGLVIFLRLTGYSMDKCVIILVCYGVILAGWLFLQFFSRRSYFRKLEQLTDQLDRRYLLGELMPESFGLGRSQVPGTDPQIQQIGNRADTPDGTKPKGLPGVH